MATGTTEVGATDGDVVVAREWAGADELSHAAIAPSVSNKAGTISVGLLVTQH